MKLKLIVLTVLLFGACSDANEPASLTFIGVGQTSFDPSSSGGLDVVIGPDGGSALCTTDDDCAAVASDPCRVSVCGSEGSCEEIWKEDGTSCDDGDICTEGEACASGECAGGENTCPCDSDADCMGPNFDLCLGDWSCQENTCQLAPGTAVECEDNLGACLESVCKPSTGTCEGSVLEDGESCDDGDACTGDSRCAEGVCFADPDSNIECDDANECTSDSCEPETGCVFLTQEGSCDDGDVCTLGETCQEGACVAVDTLECTTDNECMNAECDSATGCIEVPKKGGATCDDGNACTDGDECDEGSCVAGQSVCDCESDADCADDGDLCNGVPTCVANECVIEPDTVPQCDDASECINLSCVPATGKCQEQLVADGSPCSDGLGCTENSKCTGGTCVGTPKICDDGNSCTVDSCEVDLGACVFTATDGACDDGEPCTLGDKCLNGGCVGGSKDLCPDGDACTVDKCTEGVGCEWAPVNCNDGNKCTDDECTALAGCKNSPKVCDKADVVCVMEKCSEVSGLCVDTVGDGVACNDGDACTVGDSCVGSQCQGTADCDDGNPCTLDSCEVDGCLNAPGATGEPCDDGDACTSEDQCGTGVCQGLLLDCVDDNPCTEEACQGGDCVITAVPGCEQNIGCDENSSGKPCNDGDGDTIADVCVQGVCRGFELQRVNGSKATGNIAYTNTNRALGRWFLTSTMSGGEAGTQHNIEGYDDFGEAPVKQIGGTAVLPFTALHEGYAVSEDGFLREFIGQHWSTETAVALGLQDSGMAQPTSVWVYRGADDTQIFIAGQDGEAPYIRECSSIEGLCTEQSLFMPNNYWFGDTHPKALTGREICDAGECFPAVILAGDAESDQGYYNNVHFRDPQEGDFQSWYGDWWSGGFQTGNIAAYGDGRYILNGPEGYVRYFDGGNWSNTLDDLKGGTGGLEFTGLWIGADVVVMVANYTVAKDKFGTELWIGARDSGAYYNNTWNVYDLGEQKGASAGYFGVWGAPDGQIRLVGSGIDSGKWQDGLILVRKP